MIFNYEFADKANYFGKFKCWIFKLQLSLGSGIFSLIYFAFHGKPASTGSA